MNIMNILRRPRAVGCEPVVDERPLWLRRFGAAVERYIGAERLGLVLALIALSAFLGVWEPGKFLRPVNLMNIALAISVTGLVAIAETVVMISGGLDVSVGAIVGLSSVCAAMAMVLTDAPLAGALASLSLDEPIYVTLHITLHVIVGVLAGLLMGVVAGAVNGLLVTVGRMNPVITTLATVSVFSGAAYITTGGQAVGVINDAFNSIGNGRVWGIPIPVLLLLVIAVVIGVFLSRTDIGRNVYAMGGNPAAARLAGINLDRYKLGIYVLCGLICGLAGVITTARTNSGIPTTTQTDLNFQAITAAVLGGTALAGGKGTVVGTLLGVLIIGTLNNGMIILNVQTFYQMVARGLLLIFAVLLQDWRLRQR